MGGKKGISQIGFPYAGDCSAALSERAMARAMLLSEDGGEGVNSVLKSPESRFVPASIRHNALWIQ